ncbi:MAG: transcription antitermination factor NusB [Candidatus Brocadiales bacterium]
MRKRSQGRELALQALYQFEICGKEAAEEVQSFCKKYAKEADVYEFAISLVNGCLPVIKELDEKIASVAENWDVRRMAVIDRNILRLAVYELLYRNDIPPKVSINEAIDLAKRYSTENSGTFVNGILDKIFTRYAPEKQVRSSELGVQSEDCRTTPNPKLPTPNSTLLDEGLADLHVHTNCSDGTLSPEEVVQEASRIGLHTIAITDHDSVAGVKIAQRCASKYNIYVVPALELSGYHESFEVHILGYFVDIENEGLCEKTVELFNDRVKRIYKIVEKLQALEVSITAEEIFELSGNATPGRMHVAEVLYRKGFCGSYQEAFQRYISDVGPAYVQKKTITVFETINLIISAGGVPVLAHPGLTKKDELIPSLVEGGLQGIEAYYPASASGGPEHQAKYLKIAEKYGLLVTGGSDFHGERKPSIPLGKVTIPNNLVGLLRNKAQTAKSHESQVVSHNS